MKTYKDFSQLKTVQSTEYKGKLQTYQNYGNKLKGKKVMQYEIDKYNLYQNFLYKRALSGLKVYDQKQIKEMHRDKKNRIKKVNYRAQKVLNLFKQKRLNLLTNEIFKKYLPNSEFTNFILDNNHVDNKFRCKLPLYILHIEKDDIVSLFMKEGILPKDFLKIKIENEI